jgi:HSP20 family protein
MHTIIDPVLPESRSASSRAAVESFCQPKYDTQELHDAMKLVVYLPGIEAAGVDIEANTRDVTVTARRPHLVRVNWQSLHLENALRDYRLKLRLGTRFDYTAMQAEISHGVLTVTLPKRAPHANRRLQHAA